MTGNKRQNVFIKEGTRLNFGNSIYFCNTKIIFFNEINLVLYPVFLSWIVPDKTFAVLPIMSPIINEKGTCFMAPITCAIPSKVRRETLLMESDLKDFFLISQ